MGTGKMREPSSDSGDTTPSSGQPSEQAHRSSGERKPYRAPQVQRLGSVRDLTLGSTTGIPDGIGATRHT
jgi:hypothetical protein